MIKGIYALYDKIALCYKDPCTALNDSSITRSFAMLVNNSDTEFNFSPGDFDLVKIAEFNDVTGELCIFDPHPIVCNGSSLVRRSE